MKILLSFLLAFTSLAIGSFLPRDTKGSSLESSPNPIAKQYPNNVTGTINGTVAVIPIPYALARSIIPRKYSILKKAYESLLPGFPPNNYPLVVRTIVDHDIRFESLNLSIPDFQSAHIRFPFVDLLADGYSNFAWENYLLVTGTNKAAIDGVAAYGEIPVPASFTPVLEAYECLSAAGNKREHTGQGGSCGKGSEISFNAYTSDSKDIPAVSTKFAPLAALGPWPLNFYVNVTNQPTFGNGTVCDQQITFYNTTVSTGQNAPVGLKGEIRIKKPYLQRDEDSFFNDVYGIKVDVAWIENNWLNCDTLKGI